MPAGTESEERPSCLSISPTFKHSSSVAAEMAARVGENPISDADDCDCESHGSIIHFRENLSDVHEMKSEKEIRRDHNIDDDDEFEFAILCEEPDVYPVFDMKLFLNNGYKKDGALEKLKTKTKTKPKVRCSPLMNAERGITSSSPSAAEDLESIPSELYCAWSPKTEETLSGGNGKCKKSNSTGSSNRWKLAKLLYNYNRSKSGGADVSLFMTSPKNKKIDHRAMTGGGGGGGNFSKKIEGKAVSGGVPAYRSDHIQIQIQIHGRNGDRAMKMKESDKRMKSYLPYRQGSVGCV